MPDSEHTLRELATDAIPVAMVVVDSFGAVTMVNGAAGQLFGLTEAARGRPFQDLEISSRPADLHSARQKVQKEQRALVIEQVEWPTASESIECFDIHLMPVTDAAGTTLGVAITFLDVSDTETAYRELRSTTGELETTNDALASINDELRMRTGELDELHGFLESLLASQGGSLAIIDRDLRILIWNDQSAELWGVRADEAPGQHFLNLSIGLPVEDLRAPIKRILIGGSQRERIELDATNRKGKDFRCQVVLTPLLTRDRDIRGVIVVMEDVS